jgi:hypothetical protein
MTQATHTPTGWYVKCRNGQKRPTICEHTYGGKVIAQMADGQPREIARLIAAAPDLLAALKGILEDDAHTTSLADQRARWTSRMAAAAAAVAKAEGR